MNRLLADDSHDMPSLILLENEKTCYIHYLSSAADVNRVLWVNYFTSEDTSMCHKDTLLYHK